MNSSGVLEIDFPSSISMMFAENGEAFFQRLNVEDKEIQSPSKEEFAMVEKYAPKKYDDLMDFDFSKAISNAQDFINKEGNNSLNYTISSLAIYSYKNKFLRTITFQATPKEGGTETNLLPGRRIQTTRNYYEFKFKILEDSQVKLME